jgi:hypothetical protein
MRKVTLPAMMLLAFTAPSIAQPYVRDLAGIAFYRDSVAYHEPLSGGLNAPMQQFVDIDGDGDLDLFIFDSDFYTVRLFFRNTGDSASPSFSLEPGGGFTGAQFSFWFRFLDYDGDGTTELLTDNGSNGVRVWRNDGTAHDPVWTVSAAQLTDTTGASLFAGFGSLPGFADFDGDGLLDFLSSNSADGSFNYYRNTGALGAPAYALVSNRFGGITITSDTCTQGGAPAPAAENPLHGMGAVSLADLDGNGTVDLFYGDFFSHSIFLLRNTGTPAAPALSCESNFFPPDGSLMTAGFNQASFADIDADGDPDLFVGVLNSRTRFSFWHYVNTGSPGIPNFELASKDYLATLDVGQNARPALADLDGDLDLDLVVGNNDGQLWYFRNDGSTLSPVYHLIDTAFAGITGNYSYAPVFADLDADGDADLILGRFDGRVIIYANDGAGGFTASDTLLVSQYAVPAVGDVDSDGDMDLIIGKGNGTLSFFRNDGTPAAYNFLDVTDTYLGTDFGDDARPALRFNPSTGLTDLFVAPAAGDGPPGSGSRIFHYRNTGSVADTTFVLDDDHYGPAMPYEPAMAFGDLDGDGDDDLLVGTSKGGLVYFRNDGAGAAAGAPPEPGTFRLAQNFPNPFNSSTIITVDAPWSSSVSAAIYDVYGRVIGRLADGPAGEGPHTLVWNAAGKPTGVYYCRVTAGNRSGAIKMLLIK